MTAICEICIESRSLARLGCCDMTARGDLVLEARRSARRVDALIRENQIEAATDEAAHVSYLLARLTEAAV